MKRPIEMILRHLFVLLILGAGCGGQPSNNRVAEDSINARDMERHVLALASDEFLGRKPFTDGETKTVEYLKSEFEKMGLKGGNEGSFFQEVPLVEIAGTPSKYMEVAGGGEILRLRFPDDYIASTRRIWPSSRTPSGSSGSTPRRSATSSI